MAVTIEPATTALLTFPEYREEGERLAGTLNLPCGKVEIHRFPDLESRVCLPQTDAEHLLLCRSLHAPNNKLIELILVAETARQMGAKRITLVAPYLCYMRQDIAFHPGESVSQKIIGKLLAHYLDDVITVDPHLHRISRLEEAIPTRQAIALSATPAFSEFLARQQTDAILIGPDEESEQWVKHIAEPAGLEYGIALKRRKGDREVEISLPALEFAGRNIILVDDVASTGKTLAVAAEELYRAGAARVDALVTHALFTEGAESCIRNAGIRQLWSTDSIPHSSNEVQLAPLLASAIRNLE